MTSPSVDAMCDCKNEDEPLLGVQRGCEKCSALHKQKEYCCSNLTLSVICTFQKRKQFQISLFVSGLYQKSIENKQIHQ